MEGKVEELTGNPHGPIAVDQSGTTNTAPSSDGLVEKETAVNSDAPSQRQSSEENGVDVLGAEKQFAELQRQISGISQASRKLSRQQSRVKSLKHGAGGRDLEKATPSDSSEDAEPFDLEDTLRGNKRLEEEAGIKSKQIGVIWENLTVKGVGGTKIIVPTFPDAFTNFFLFPLRQLMRLLPLSKETREVCILRDFTGVVRPGEMVLVRVATDGTFPLDVNTGAPTAYPGLGLTQFSEFEIAPIGLRQLLILLPFCIRY